MEAVAAALQPSLPALQTTTLITLLGSTAQLRPPLPAVRYAAVVHAIRLRLRAPHGAGPAGFTARNCANAAFAAGQLARLAAHSSLRYAPLQRQVGQLMDELLHCSGPQLVAGQLNSIDLLLMLQGLAAARHPADPEWLRRHEAQAKLRLGLKGPTYGAAPGSGSGAATAQEAAAASDGGDVISLEQLVLLHRAYRVLGYDPVQLPRPPPAVRAEVMQAVRDRERAGQRRRAPSRGERFMALQLSQQAAVARRRKQQQQQPAAAQAERGVDSQGPQPQKQRKRGARPGAAARPAAPASANARKRAGAAGAAAGPAPPAVTHTAAKDAAPKRAPSNVFVLRSAGGTDGGMPPVGASSPAAPDPGVGQQVGAGPGQQARGMAAAATHRLRRRG